VLLNIGDSHHKNDPSKSFWEFYICQFSFMLVLSCHIPFIFFSGKEAILIIVDEITRKSISSALWHKLQGNAHFSMAPEHQEVPNPNLPIPGDNVKQSFQQVFTRNSETSDVSHALKASRMHSQAVMTHISAVAAQRMAY
jgi:hypothetical protein